METPAAATALVQTTHVGCEQILPPDATETWNTDQDLGELGVEGRAARSMMQNFPGAHTSSIVHGQATVPTNVVLENMLFKVEGRRQPAKQLCSFASPCPIATGKVLNLLSIRQGDVLLNCSRPCYRLSTQPSKKSSSSAIVLRASWCS